MSQSDGGREFWNPYIRSVGMTIAHELESQGVGDGRMPMADQDFDFYNWGRKYVRLEFGLDGMAADHLVSDTLMTLCHRANDDFEEGEGNRGPIFDYPNQVARVGHLIPWDRYFIAGFKQKAITERRRSHGTGKNRTKRHVSIVPGHPDQVEPGGGMSQELVEVGTPLGTKTPGPIDVLGEREEREIVDKIIPEQLALLKNERDSKILSEFYRMYVLEGAKLWEVGKRLDQLGETDSDYWPKGGKGEQIPWATSTLGRYLDTIAGIMQRYYHQKSVGRKRVLTSREERVVFQSRRA